MAVLLALGGALIYGFADFAGGSASRRAPALAVVLCGQLASLAVLAVVLTAFPSPLSPAGLGWGAGAGACGAIALLLFYRSLAIGAMSVVAPLTAVVSAVVPVVVGLGTGDRPAPAALLGVLLALGAVVLVGAEGGRLPSPASLRGPALAGALAAGALFGLWIVVLSHAPADSGFWPTAGARAASIPLLAAVGLASRRVLVARGAPPLLVIASGCGDLTANLLFVLASREGMLTIVGVLLALYPAGTVLLALVVLKERLARLQVAGLGLAAAGAVLIAVR